MTALPRAKATPPRRSGLSPVWLVLAGIASVQVGAAFAKQLFGQIDPTAMVWLRLAASALMLGLIARPRLAGRSRSDWLHAVAFGTALAVMNWAFYESFARIPLGLAVTIEFAGPLTLALVLSQRRSDIIWVALAASGVVLLGLEPGDLDPAGVVFALLAGAAWAAYILLAERTGTRWPGLDGLAVASAVGALLLTGFALPVGGAALLDPRVLAVGFAVGLLSSVVPYSLDLIALRRLPAPVFSILMSLEPAAAALVGMLLLEEFLSPLQLLAIGCVVAASVGVTRSAARRGSRPQPDPSGGE